MNEDDKQKMAMIIENLKGYILTQVDVDRQIGEIEAPLMAAIKSSHALTTIELKGYHSALVERGFTDDQAFQLLMLKLNSEVGKAAVTGIMDGIFGKGNRK